MNFRPAYFDTIREHATKRWDQLEHDPELAGPWHQLFKQVQSPRHVLSELLQNADDAGATGASVRIENGVFIFSHNGEDFTEENFASLCRFGYSNKRALHTIGFRGIGFKSTFSLGDKVELYTPTLSVVFSRQRFTEPKWIEYPHRNKSRTEIRVAISDGNRQHEIEKNLQDWLKSPVSLLFFKHLRQMHIGNNEVQWKSLGSGPVSGSEWMALKNNEDQPFLIVRSKPETFPPEALSEIVQERMLGVDQDIDFPPCKVEIVLGEVGRLYVVLPSGVKTTLPFASNAPFIQDPARLKIKEPETSATNRWLLERVGKLAASVMLEWLNQADIDLAQRARAYTLLPDVDREDSSLEGICASIVEKTFDAEITDKAYLLTNDGDLTPANQSVAIPEELFNVWPAAQASAMMDKAGRPALSRHVSYADKKKLVNRNVIEEIDKNQVLSLLQSKRPPKPESWRGLLYLWAYIAPNIKEYDFFGTKNKLCIVPVQGKDVLYSTREVVRLGEKKLLQSDDDWQFLASRLLVLNQNWLRFLAEQRRNAEEREDKILGKYVNSAYEVLDIIGLKAPSDVSEVITQVAEIFFNQEELSLSGCIHIAQIAAKLSATVNKNFHFVTQDCHRRTSKEVLIFDRDNTLSGLLPENWCSANLLHPDYLKSFKACNSEDWLKWILSGRALIHTFVPFVQKKQHLWTKQSIEAELRTRGYTGSFEYHYKTNMFVIEDWDFVESLWYHWIALAKNDTKLWGCIVERILTQPETFWSKAKAARAYHVATTGNTKAICDPFLPTWICKLRDLSCLPDTRGFYHKPAELLRRTPETESLIDVEPFIQGSFDRESTRPLLKLLGVSEVPIGPDRLLDCLRALAKTDKPPIHEVEKWYRRLDQMVNTCSTVALDKIKTTFHDEKIILTENTGWSCASGVFLFGDEEGVPGIAVIRSSVKDLTFWRKIGVSEQPTPELAIRWLKEIASGQVVSKEDGQRIRALLSRYAVRIWDECGHWLNLAGEWVPVDTLKYALTMQSLVSWQHLHPWVKQQTADLQRLTSEIIQMPPFSVLPMLAAHIEDRFHRNPLSTEHPEQVPWLNQIGLELCRIILDDENETSRIRKLAEDLANTTCQIAPGLEIIPYIDEKPAGTPRRADVVWFNKVLYVSDLPNPKLACEVPRKLAAIFVRPDISSAFSYCFKRSAEDITAYIEENFNLEPRKEIKDPVEEEQYPLDSEEPFREGEKAKVKGKDFFEIEKEEEEEDEYLDEEDIEKSSKSPRPRPPKTYKTYIVENFARNLGYRKDGDNRFVNDDGSLIIKTAGHSFPWEKLSASGDIICYYLPKDHCLEFEPLQIESDIWGLLEKYPEKYFLILSRPNGEPVEVSGGQLLAMRDEGKITLCPATYRLVYEHKEK